MVEKHPLGLVFESPEWAESHAESYHVGLTEAKAFMKGHTRAYTNLCSGAGRFIHG
jgi:hypothetical protein